MLRAHRAHTLTVVAVVVVRVDVVRIEVQVTCVVRVVRVERTRPVVAVRTCVVERTIVAIPGSRQENALSCFGSHLMEMQSGTSNPYIRKEGMSRKASMFFLKENLLSKTDCL